MQTKKLFKPVLILFTLFLMFSVNVGAAFADDSGGDEPSANEENTIVYSTNLILNEQGQMVAPGYGVNKIDYLIVGPVLLRYFKGKGYTALYTSTTGFYNIETSVNGLYMDGVLVASAARVRRQNVTGGASVQSGWAKESGDPTGIFWRTDTYHEVSNQSYFWGVLFSKTNQL